MQNQRPNDILTELAVACAEGMRRLEQGFIQLGQMVQHLAAEYEERQYLAMEADESLSIAERKARESLHGKLWD